MPNTINSCLDQTRDEATALLGTFEEFPQGLVCSAHEDKDLNTQITEALASLSLAIFVMPPEPLQALEAGGDTIVFFPQVLMKVRIVQNVTLSPLALTARGARDVVMRRLQGWMPTTPGVAKPLNLAKNPQNLVEFPGEIIIDVRFLYASALAC